MTLLCKDIELVIFDLDGTLIDSTSLWADIDREFFARRNMEVPPEYGKEIAHLGLSTGAKFTIEKYLPNEKEEDIINEWHQMSVEAYKYHIPLKEHVIELLELLKKLGVKLAAATANSRELYEPCLTRLDIYKYFEIVMDVNSCENGKNSPEIYDKIARHFGFDRNQVAIAEDMLTSLMTAYNNGYISIGIYDKNSVVDRKENEKYSHIYIDDYRDLIKKIKKENNIQ